MRHFSAMSADEVIATVASMPSADWLKIQAGLAEMVAPRFSGDDVAEICAALAEAEAEFARGETLSGGEMARVFSHRLRPFRSAVLHCVPVAKPPRTPFRMTAGFGFSPMRCAAHVAAPGDFH